jgi:hypothetical protein
MRHHISTNQLVIWPRHELTQTWAPTGIVHPPQQNAGTANHAVGERHDDGERQGEVRPETDSVHNWPPTTILTRSGGVCTQVTKGNRVSVRGVRSGGHGRPCLLRDLM